MIDYARLDWKTLTFFKLHLYQRFAAPVSQAISHLERLQIIIEEGLAPDRLNQTQYQLEGALNLLNAWATLITYKDQGPLQSFQFKPFQAEGLPPWLRSQLEALASLRNDFTHTIQIHPESFYEGLWLLSQVAASLGELVAIQLVDAVNEQPGVYLRVIFSARGEASPLPSLGELRERFDLDDMAGWNLYMQYLVAQDMLSLNNARFTLQNNRKTGQQAFAAFFRAQPKATDALDEFDVEALEQSENSLGAAERQQQREADEILKRNLKKLMQHLEGSMQDDQKLSKLDTRPAPQPEHQEAPIKERPSTTKVSSHLP